MFYYLTAKTKKMTKMQNYTFKYILILYREIFYLPMYFITCNLRTLVQNYHARGTKNFSMDNFANPHKAYRGRMLLSYWSENRKRKQRRAYAEITRENDEKRLVLDDGFSRSRWRSETHAIARSTCSSTWRQR